MFCSDDKNARNGVVSIGGARCISVLSSFVRLKKEIGFTKEDAVPYIDSYMNKWPKLTTKLTTTLGLELPYFAAFATVSEKL